MDFVYQCWNSKMGLALERESCNAIDINSQVQVIDPFGTLYNMFSVLPFLGFWSGTRETSRITCFPKGMVLIRDTL